MAKKYLGFILFWLLFLPQLVNATQFSYYGEHFYNSLEESAKNNRLKPQLFTILSSQHIVKKNQFDLIVSSCPRTEHCIGHRKHSYKMSRQFLFGRVHLQRNQKGYFIKDVYCNEIIHNRKLAKEKPLGPGKIPDPRVINTEHTWPQSKFSTNFSRTLQKSDLHGLYPVLSRANSLRSNHSFQEVENITSQVCSASAKGTSPYVAGSFFEPPNKHKGNVARALFYFSTRYKLPLAQHVEETLRLWHTQDPVDEEEIERNEQIFNFQEVRNPFIDHDWLVEYINDF